jgi:hypothetical protein
MGSGIMLRNWEKEKVLTDLAGLGVSGYVSYCTHDRKSIRNSGYCEACIYDLIHYLS